MRRRSARSPSATQHPGRDDAARPRRLPGVASAQPRHDGHARRGLGQHGDPGSRPADRLRHALRRPRHRQPQDLRAERARRSTSTSTRRRSTRTSRVDVGIVGDLRDVLETLLPRRRRRRSARDWLRAHRRAQGRLRGPRHPEPARRRAPLRRARHQRPLARDRGQARSSSPTSASTRCGKRSTTSTTSRARSSPRAASARWASRCRRRSAPRSRGPDAEVWVVVGDGGFQMTMCELATIAQEKLDIKVAIINNGYLGMVRQWQEFFYERRYAATPLLEPGLREARRGATACRGIAVTQRADVVPAVEAARAHAGHGASSTSASSRKTPSTRWCRPAPTCTR